jgi:hypothetical protein
MKHTNLSWTDIRNLFVAERFFLLMLGLLLTGCVYTDKPKFQGSTSSLIRPGYVKLCTISKINEYKNDTECPIGKVSRQPDGSFAIDDAYQSARGDSGKMFNVVDIGKDVAALEIQNKSILAEKKMGVRDGYVYQIALKQSNGAFFLYGINCSLPEDTSLKLILADIIIPDGANCNIAGLSREQTVSFFKTLLATKWYVEDGDYTSGMHQFTYQPTIQGEKEYQRRYAQGLADEQKYLAEKKTQELANTKKQEIDWDVVAERYKNELKHQRKMDCLGRGGGVFCN